MKLPIHKMVITIASEFDVHSEEYKYLFDAYHHEKLLKDCFDGFAGMTFKVVKHDVYDMGNGKYIGAFGFALTEVD